MQIKLGCYRVGNIWKSQQDVFKLLVSHFRRYHLMEIQDVYKLFYQGVFGSAHALQSSTRTGFETVLQDEFERITEDKNQPLWESIHPEGKIVRVNLPAYKAHALDFSLLLTLCLWTAEISEKEKGGSENIANAFDTFYKLCKSRKIPKFDPVNVEKYQRWLVENKFPVVHHSEAYRMKYDPHYRLVHREFLSMLS
jgi:hypothetical protein